MTTTTPTAGMGTDAMLPWQRLQRRRARGLGLWPALWLALCMLLAQHAGLAHRIHHGGLLSPALLAPLAQDDADGSALATSQQPQAEPDLPLSLKLAGHFCVLFDGATIAAPHGGMPAMPALTHLQSPVPFSVGWRRPDLQHPQPFHSRAPPAVPAFA